MSQSEQEQGGGELWPHEEARRLLSRAASFPAGRPVIFDSGFGPSGLPHLGTMCEVLRPSYVRHALHLMEPARPARLIVFIDDLDGLRKVPESIPGRERFIEHIGKPVSRIPDPFGCCVSFADHMIGLLGGFLRPIAVEYELMRSSECYSSGFFDPGLRLVLQRHEQIKDIILPTLREENRAQWSPILPLCPACGQINSTLVTAYHPERDTVEFSCEKAFGGAKGCGFAGEQTILGGKSKVQWKVDWALRWYSLKVDYELYGKDLIDSARLSGQIVKLLGAEPPLGFSFELFLDEHGQKISKSKGSGVSVDQWQSYAPIEVLKYFLLLNPKRARKLFLQAIPQYVDEYLGELRAYSTMEDKQKSPLEFILQPGSPRCFKSELSFSLIMNLVGALGSSDRELIWNYLKGYDPAIEADADTQKMAQQLAGCALNFYRDFIEPNKLSYTANEAERAQLRELFQALSEVDAASAEAIEKTIYELGRRHYDKPGKIFPLLYKVLLGQERGPRLGVFIKLITPKRAMDKLAAAIGQ